MLLTRNGRFNPDTFYTEAPHFSQDNAYDNALLTQIKNALKTNFNIDESLLAKLEKGYKRSNKLPNTVIAKYIKKAPTPAVASPAPKAPSETPAVSQGAPKQARGTPDVAVQTDTQQAQAKTDEEKTKLESLINDVIPVDQIQSLTANGKLMTTDRQFDGTRLLYLNESGGEFIAIPYNKTDYFVFARPDKFTGEDPFYEYGEEIISLFFDIKKGSQGHIIGERPCIVRPAVGNHGVPLTTDREKKQLYSVVKKGSITQGSH